MQIGFAALRKFLYPILAAASPLFKATNPIPLGYALQRFGFDGGKPDPIFK